jgi:hypothetical protein
MVNPVYKSETVHPHRGGRLMLDKLRENIERLAIGDPLQFYMLVGLLALLVLAMLLVAFTDSGSDASNSATQKKPARKAASPDQTVKMAKNGSKSGAKSVREKTPPSKAASNAAGKSASTGKKAGKKAAGKTDQQEIPADFALLRRDSEPPPDTPAALARLTEIEQEMLALRDLFQSGEISRETYVTDSRALFDEAEKLASQG